MPRKSQQAPSNRAACAALPGTMQLAADALARIMLALVLVFGCSAPSIAALAPGVAYADEDADQKKADKVTELIEKLPAPEAAQSSDRAAYEKVKKEYDDLSDAQRKLIKKELREKLKDVGARIAAAEEAEAAAAAAAAQEAADRAAAQVVIDLANALPSASAAKAADEAAATEAKAAYNALTDAQKAYVDASVVSKIDAVIAAAQADAQVQAEAGKEKEKEQSQGQGGNSGQSSGSQESGGGQADPSQSGASEQGQQGGQEQGASQEPGSSGSSGAGGQPESGEGKSGGSAPSESAPAEQPEQEDEGDDGTDPNATYFVDTLLLKWDEADEFGEKHFVGDSTIVEKDYKQIDIEDYGETVQLTGWYSSTDGTGVIYQTSDSTTHIGGFDLTWSSSDESVATVTPAGLVKPRGKNGSTTITATVADKHVYKGKAPRATVTINFDGQDGKYVEKVEILDADGNVIGEDWGGVTVYEEENAFHQLQARVTWLDAKTGKETVQVTGSGEDYDAKAVDTTITWGVSSSSAFSINKDTGRLRCGSYSGNAYVTCTVVGGKGGAEVRDTANVQLDTGVYEYNPANSLTLKVVWEERPDEVVKEATYSYADLLGLLSTQHVDATVVNASRYGVVSADGFLFKDVVDLVAVDDADVLQYRFGTADGYDNPVSYQYLFESGPRYYFPNYDLGGSTAGGTIVPPILAYQSTFEWNRSQANPSAKMDEGTRFRLVFGCLGAGDANTSFQIYYINSITVVLKGAPSAGGEGGTGPGGDGVDSGTDAGEGSQPGDGQDGQGGQDGQDGAQGDSSDGDGSQGQGDQGRSVNAADARGGSSQQSDAAAETEKSEKAATAEPAEGADIGQAKRWRVYQMMNKTNSDVPDWDDENPVSPFAAPVAIGAFAIGAGATGFGFRRRLK